MCTTDREGSESVMEEVECGVPVVCVFGVRTGGGEELLFVRIAQQADLVEETLNGAVGNAADEAAERDRNEAEGKGNSPKLAINFGHREGGATDEDDEDLDTDF